MDFRTALTLSQSSWSVGHADPILTMGSCFASSMGDRFVAGKFNSCVNPFGTTYHPLAIHRLIRLAASRELPEPDGYVEHHDTWHHFDFHSSLCAASREELQRLLTERINVVNDFLLKSRVIILTYGTAWVYELSQNQRPVANCQKVPSSLFSKRLANPEEITTDFQRTFQSLRALNPAVRVILTVSPVRHVKDTLPLNQVSKSILRLACHQLQETESFVEYFPAYELMVDDLRDYRFYADDLIHPTPFAEEYIWEKFGGVYFSEDTQQFLKRWEPLRQALAHRPLNPTGQGYRDFLTKTLQQLERMQLTINVNKEIELVKEQLLQAEAR